jgi:hypothetical protein
MECEDRKHQRELLTEGLAVRDVQSILDDGSRAPVRSTMGIRIATASEIREAKKQEEYGHPIPMVEPYRGFDNEPCFELVIAD